MSLGGDLWVISRLGQGSKFTFTMNAFFTRQNSEREMNAILGKELPFQRLDDSTQKSGETDDYNHSSESLLFFQG